MIDRRFITALLLCAGSAFISRAAPAAEPAVFAIVVGNNASPVEDPSLAPLRFADDDAVRFHQLLSRLSDEIRFLSVLDADTQKRNPALASSALAPSWDKLQAAFAELARSSRAAQAEGRKTTLYFVFSGHGSNDQSGEPYLALLGRGLTKKMLFDQLISSFPADRIHLIIDACNAGALVSGRGAFDKEINARSSTVSAAEVASVLSADSLAGYPHVGAIVATSAGRESHEWSRIESGVFTHELLSGLLGPADVNGDLAIEYSEIEAFIASTNSRVADPRARPDIQAHPPALDQRAPLLRLNEVRSGPFLRAREGGLGRFHIELENGQRYLDANLSSDMPFVVSLPADVDAYVRTDTREGRVPKRESGIIELEDVGFGGRVLAHKGSLDDEYRRSLFAAPYDRKYYQGYVDSRALVPVLLDDDVSTSLDFEPSLPTARKVAIGLWGLGGTAVITAVVTGVLAAQTKSDFESTNIQAEAMRLSDRYDALILTTWLSSGLAAAAGGSGVALWITSRPEAPAAPHAQVGARTEAHFSVRW